MAPPAAGPGFCLLAPSNRIRYWYWCVMGFCFCCCVCVVLVDGLCVGCWMRLRKSCSRHFSVLISFPLFPSFLFSFLFLCSLIYSPLLFFSRLFSPLLFSSFLFCFLLLLEGCHLGNWSKFQDSLDTDGEVQFPEKLGLWGSWTETHVRGKV